MSAAIRLTNTWTEQYLNQLITQLKSPEAEAIRKEIVKVKLKKMEAHGAKYKGSFLGRNAGEGNTGMHHSKARGKVSSLSVETGRAGDGNRPWCLTKSQLHKASKVFKALDKDGSCLLDPSELADTFGIENLCEQMDLNGDGQVSLREWRKYISDLKADLHNRLTKGCSRPAVIARRLSVVPAEIDSRSPPVIARRTDEEFDRFLGKMQLKVGAAQPSPDRFDWGDVTEYIVQEAPTWKHEEDHMRHESLGSLDIQDDNNNDDNFECGVNTPSPKDSSRPVTRGGSSRGSQRSMSMELTHLRACIMSPVVDPSIDATECVCDQAVCTC